MRVKLCELNAENLFLSMEYYGGEALDTMSESQWSMVALAQLRRHQKPLSKIWGVAHAVTDIDADVVMLVEVGGRDSLENFNRHFLGDTYEPHFVEGNSRRNIDLGFLVKRTLGLKTEVFSNRETPVEVSSFRGRSMRRFSRDVAELRLSDGNGLRLIILLTHLKSKLSTADDVEGKDARTAEAIALAGIYQRLRSEYPQVPIVVGGDFNADLSSLELELLRRTDLVDFHDQIGTAEEDRYSLFHFDHAGNPRGLVLDYLLVSPHLEARIVASESQTYRYKGFYGLAERLPTSIAERYRMPSDHFPLVLTVVLPEL